MDAYADESTYFQYLQDRKAVIQKRIQDISGVALPIREKVDDIKIDYHWDILLKEVVSDR